LSGAGPAAVRIRDLRITYAGRREPALDGVSLEVAAGSIVGIAGRIGAGKSTLALATAGFIPRVVHARTEGTVAADGVDAIGATAGDLLGRVGIVFATPANQLSASKLTVREELAFGLENLGVPRQEMDQRIDLVLEQLGIGHLADREPFALSGGEQQRVAIASIVAMGTRVVVLDEPTAQLDPIGTATVSDLLVELGRDGAAILVAEHDPAILSRTASTLVLDHGHEVALDRPGVALAPGVLGRVGLASPTIVALAAAAGVPAERAFDEDAVVEALGSGGPGRMTVEPTPSIAWNPIRETSPTSIGIEGVSHTYPTGLEALRDVSIRFEAGETVAIVGQNGSGKTTLAKHFNGLLRPTTGRVLVGDGDIATTPVNRVATRVGFVFQNPDDQLFERSVRREIGFGPRNVGTPADTAVRLVAAALDAVGLTDVAAVNPYDLDLSRRKLVALASVLAIDPSALVLDEPTTGQDSPGVARVGAVVDAFRTIGRAVIAITHDMEFAAQHFSRIVVMRRGEVILDGPPESVFAVEQTALLASAGVAPPVASRIGARLGLGSTPTIEALLGAMRRPGRAPDH
jgi:energy-coupling factor transport system ATP-binding protein